MTKRDESKAATAEQVKAAAKSLFRQLGFERVTIRDVAMRAGLSTGAIFASFEGKGELFKACFGRPAPTARHVADVLVKAKNGQAFPHELETLARDLVGWGD